MSATWFDHAIATVAPRMAARRVMARQAFETLTRGYDGAARGRRTEGWRAPGSSADTEIGVAGALLRDPMRDLVLNNPHAANAVAVLVNNIIGAGIMPRSASGDDKLDRTVDALFERWTADCDADGQDAHAENPTSEPDSFLRASMVSISSGHERHDDQFSESPRINPCRRAIQRVIPRWIAHDRDLCAP